MELRTGAFGIGALRATAPRPGGRGASHRLAFDLLVVHCLPFLLMTRCTIFDFQANRKSKAFFGRGGRGRSREVKDEGRGP